VLGSILGVVAVLATGVLMMCVSKVKLS